MRGWGGGGGGGESSVPVCTAIFNPLPLSSLINHPVSVDVRKAGDEARRYHRAQELCVKVEVDVMGCRP